MNCTTKYCSFLSSVTIHLQMHWTHLLCLQWELLMLLLLLIYFYTVMNRFMSKLQKDQYKHSLITLFYNNFRYLDDILSVNNPDFLMFVKFIPRNLRWIRLILQATQIIFFYIIKVNLTHSFKTKETIFLPFS
jgi:hypothetical protein